MKTKNPYLRLLDDIKDWCHRVKYRHEKDMRSYPKSKLAEGWRLDDLYERTKAAEQLGYDVQLVAHDNGLTVRYKKKVPDVPYSWL